MLWKNILAAVIAALVPILYSYFIIKFPDFPIPEGFTLAFLLWLVGMLVGGWNLKCISIKIRYHRR